MIPILDQSNAGSFISRVTEFRSNVVSMKESTINAIEAIGSLCEKINDGIEWWDMVLNNPAIINTFLNQASMVIILVLVLLKALGFENLEKWICVTIILKVVVLVLL